MMSSESLIDWDDLVKVDIEEFVIERLEEEGLPDNEHLRREIRDLIGREQYNEFVES